MKVYWICTTKLSELVKEEIYMNKSVHAYLQITMVINEENRKDAVAVYTKYKGPFLSDINGALTKDLLVRDEDVQVLHGFDSKENAEAYLKSDLFNNDVFVGLKDLLAADPDIRIYSL